MKILLPFFELSGISSYPDDYLKFHGLELVEFEGAAYFITDYSGELELEIGVHNYSDYLNANPIKTGIREITVAAFYARLGVKFPILLALSDQLASQGNYDLKADLMRIDKSEFINLDDQRLQPGLNATGQFSPEELAGIFADGQPEEVPEILK